jgi:beta-glucanase (GH16 family)
MKKILIFLLAANFSFAQQTTRKLVWEDNFDGKTLNEQNWNYELGDGCPNCGWGNNERQLYTKENHELADGKLVITAKRDETKDGVKYTSTRITTAGKQEFQYGRIEARAQLPVGYGIWPAFWMLGSNIGSVGWPKSGEVDILEYIGREPGMVFTSLHTQDSHGNTVNTMKTPIKGIEVGFHVYAAEWDKDKISFFVDDELVYTFQPENKTEDTWPFNQPFYVIINMAVGGNFGGPKVDESIFPQEFIIDYVRVYQ